MMQSKRGKMHDGKMENAVFQLKCGGDPILWLLLAYENLRSRKSKEAHAEKENEDEAPGMIDAKDLPRQRLLFKAQLKVF